MHRSLGALLLIAGLVAFFSILLGVFAWLARRHEQRDGIGPDDGGRYSGGSDLDHLAVDQARDDLSP